MGLKQEFGLRESKMKGMFNAGVIKVGKAGNTSTLYITVNFTLIILYKKNSCYCCYLLPNLKNLDFSISSARGKVTPEIQCSCYMLLYNKEKLSFYG